MIGSIQHPAPDMTLLMIVPKCETTVSCLQICGGRDCETGAGQAWVSLHQHVSVTGVVSVARLYMTVTATDASTWGLHR